MNKIIKKIKLILKNIFSAICSIFYCRDNSIVLLDAWFGTKFADNPRFLFQYLSHAKEKLGLTHVIWISRNERIVDELRDLGYEAYLLESKESIKYHKKAKYLICNNAPITEKTIKGEFLGRYSYGAKKINLWHGVGVVKGLGYESNEYLIKRSKYPNLYSIIEKLHINSSVFRKLVEREGGWGDCYYVAPTIEERSKMKREFLNDDNHYIITGYARNCKCPKLMRNEEEVLDIISKYKHSIVYMPTFKTGDNNFDFRTVGAGLDDFLKENDMLWIQKGHSMDKFSEEYSLNNNVLSLTSDFDTNVIVPNIDVLVTDYSSAMMDGLFHNKPVLIFAPDYDMFVSGERGLIREADKIMEGCGFIYRDIESLMNGLKLAVNNPESIKPKEYYSTREKYWGKRKELSQIWDDIVKSID